MHSRNDYSPFLYHWIKPASKVTSPKHAMDEAYSVMQQIFECGYLRASGKDTFKNIESICFSESPKEVMRHQSSKYLPFGFAFEKEYIFELGGRHVIYQTKEEADILPPSLHWRHVTYDPSDIAASKPDGVNFTWEREWRLNDSTLNILDCHSVIVPNQDYKEMLEADIEHWKKFPEYMHAMTGTYVDSGPYKRYTPSFIELFEVL